MATAVGAAVVTAPVKKDPFRRDIQGLRAIAVVAVIVDHLRHWPGGGFVGVDVFFVISGFLITGVMLREHEKTGRISWADFYRRRIRRLIPASTLVLVATVVAAYYLYRQTRIDTIRSDAVWSFFFASNWHFAAIGTDYWQASGPVSPLRHFWSLAVEEQFYIVWPVLMIVVMGGVGRLLRRRGRSPLPLLGVVTAALTAASFLWALRDTAQNPTGAYFSTFSRAWELGVGALLAVGDGWLRRMRPVMRAVSSWVGTAGIAASLFLIDSSSRFPAPTAALPVIAAALVVAAGIGGTPRFVPLLTNPVSVYVGRISYSLYLWHFPVIILLGSAIGSTGGAELAAVGLIVVLSIASFHLVEDPVRRSKWLEPLAQGRRTLRGRRSERKAAAGYAALAAFTVAVAVLVVAALQSTGRGTDVVALAATAADDPIAQVETSSVASSLEQADLSTPEEVLSGEIQKGLTVTKWPDVTDPSIDQAQDINYQKNCGAPDVEACAENTKATKSAYILGDSIGYRLLLLAREAMKSEYDVHQESLSACFAVLVNETSLVGEDQHAACQAHKKAAIAAVQKARPDVVFIIDTYALDGRVNSNANVSAVQQWQAGMTELLSQLKGVAKHIIIISPPPVGPGIAACAASRNSSPTACTTKVSDEWKQVSEAEATAASLGGADYWDTRNWYCSADGQCPILVGNTITLADSSHQTSQYLHVLVPSFQARLNATLQKS